MKFDASTLREEMEVLEARIKGGTRDQKMIDRYLVHARKLRDQEFQEHGYVTPRNRTTGY
jgi:hypothetical protein